MYSKYAVITFTSIIQTLEQFKTRKNLSYLCYVNSSDAFLKEGKSVCTINLSTKESVFNSHKLIFLLYLLNEFLSCWNYKNKIICQSVFCVRDFANISWLIIIFILLIQYNQLTSILFAGTSVLTGSTWVTSGGQQVTWFNVLLVQAGLLLTKYTICKQN